MIVEDEQIILKGIRSIIENSIIECEFIAECLSAEQGLELLAKNDIEYDIIITDIKMPKMSGIEFVKKIRQSNKNSSIIAVSGYDVFEYAVEMLRCEAVDYLLKPVDRKMLIASIKKANNIAIAKKQKINKEYDNLGLTLRYYLSKNLQKQEEDEALEQFKKYLRKRAFSIVCIKQPNFEGDGLIIKFPSFIYLVAFDDTIVAKDNISSSSDFFKLEDELYKAYSQCLRRFLDDDADNDKKILQAIKFIEKNYANNIDMAVVSNHVNMNYTLFSNIFKKYAGKNFVSYLKDIRIEKAKELILTTNKTIKQIGLEVGYKDDKRFFKTFKKSTGLSPKQYRKEQTTEGRRIL